MRQAPAVVIVGAGILGCALAWRLAERRVFDGSDILVVDPNPVASQATSRAAALLSAARSSAKAHWSPLVKLTLAFIQELQLAGFHVPLHRCGAVHLAATDRTSEILDDIQANATSAELACERVAPSHFAARLPWLDCTLFSSALWFPDEAYTDPYQLAQAYAGAARALGVNFRFGQPARLKALGRRVAVEIAGEVIEPDMVWVAAGAWSNAVLAPLGAGLAQAAVRSQYWITGQTDLAVQDMPSVVAPDLKLYARRELGAVLFGVREACGVALPSTQLPSDLSGFVFDANDAEGLRTLEAAAEDLQRHAPGLMQAGLKHYISGPSCYTPDGELILGPLCDWDNLHVMGGCNGAGIALSGGWADLAVDGLASRSSSLARCDPARFGKLDANAPAFLARCVAARAGKSSA